jgi:hypothetical protein
MELSMKDGRVMASIGGHTFPLTTTPLSDWQEGTDVIRYSSLEKWERDCLKYVTDED